MKKVMLVCLLGMVGCSSTKTVVVPLNPAPSKQLMNTAVMQVWDGMQELQKECSKAVDNEYRARAWDEAGHTYNTCKTLQLNAGHDWQSQVNVFSSVPYNPTEAGCYTVELLRSYDGYLKLLESFGYEPSEMVKDGRSALFWMRSESQCTGSFSFKL